MVLFFDSSNELDKKQDRDRYLIWHAINGGNQQLQPSSRSKPLKFPQILLYNDFMTNVDKFNHGTKNVEKLQMNKKSIRFGDKKSKTQLDESKTEIHVDLIKEHTANLRQEFLSQTKGLLSAELKIEAINAVMENFTDAEKCAGAALLSTNLTFKFHEDKPRVAKVTDASFDIDNVTAFGVIVKDQLFDNFNANLDDASKMKSLLITNPLDVGRVLRHFYAFFKAMECFNDVMGNQSHILLNMLVSDPRSLTHKKKNKKKNAERMTELPCTSVLGRNPCRILLGFDGNKYGKNMRTFFKFFRIDILIFLSNCF
jgi:hypothetical protein